MYTPKFTPEEAARYALIVAKPIRRRAVATPRLRTPSANVDRTRDQEILALMKAGEPAPRSSQDRPTQLAMGRLRRSGAIVNHGTNTKPDWKLADES